MECYYRFSHRPSIPRTHEIQGIIGHCPRSIDEHATPLHCYSYASFNLRLFFCLANCFVGCLMGFFCMSFFFWKGGASFFACTFILNFYGFFSTYIDSQCIRLVGILQSSSLSNYKRENQCIIPLEHNFRLPHSQSGFIFQKENS